MKTDLAVVTKFPCTKELAFSMIKSWDLFINDNNPRVCAEEIFVRTNLDDCLLNGHENKYDSSWVLECLPSQQFHWHSCDSEDIYYSMRRILFVADDGLILSFLTNNKHEEIESKGPSFVELKFNGNTIHRFRPINGRLFAYSFHYKDFSNHEMTLASQSFMYHDEIPAVTNKYII